MDFTRGQDLVRRAVAFPPTNADPKARDFSPSNYLLSAVRTNYGFLDPDGIARIARYEAYRLTPVLCRMNRGRFQAAAQDVLRIAELVTRADPGDWVRDYSLPAGYADDALRGVEYER